MKICNIDEIEKDQGKAFYHCGSQRLSHEIVTKLGIQPINIYTHKKTKRIINVFVMCPELSNFLTIWSKNKQLKEVKKVE